MGWRLPDARLGSLETQVMLGERREPAEEIHGGTVAHVKVTSS